MDDKEQFTVDEILKEFSKEELEEFEDYRQIECEYQGVEFSKKDYMVWLIREGLWQREQDDDQNRIEEYIDQIPTGANLSHLLRETIVRIIRHEIMWGRESRERIIRLIREEFFEPKKHPLINENTPNAVTFDRSYKIKKTLSKKSSYANFDGQYDLDEAVKRHTKIEDILNEWLEFEGKEQLPLDFALSFSGWNDDMSYEDKLDTVGQIKRLIDYES